MPPSPFEWEKHKIGSGFIAPEPRRSRGKADRRLFPLRRSLLSDEERIYIATAPEKISNNVLAKRFALSREYVAQLRRDKRFTASLETKEEEVG